MAPKKKPDPDVSHIEVECEIAELAGETRPAANSDNQDWTAIRSMFSDFFKEQDLRQNQLLTSLSQTVQQSSQAVLTAMRIPAPIDPQPPYMGQACPPQLPINPPNVSGLYSPSNGGMDRDWEEMEDFTSEDEGEFEGFDNPSASGKTNFPVSMIMVNLVIF